MERAINVSTVAPSFRQTIAQLQLTKLLRHAMHPTITSAPAAMAS
jgi:hypothetical protein